VCRGLRLFGATVAIVEADYIVELGRRDLDDIRVLDRDHPMPEAGCDVKRLARRELAALKKKMQNAPPKKK
jgi:hypothetical protein